MTHDVGLLMTLAVAFAAAFAGGVVATRLRLPPIVGYLAAGIAVGPFTPGPVAHAGIASELAEIGVMLLMFGVGLHFSLRDLWDVRRIAVPGAVGQIAVATAMGAGLATLWGWSLASGLVFGLALSVASTVVLLRALEGLGLLESAEGRIAVGWLVVEDLAMVLALVLLPALAGALGAAGSEAPAAGGASLALTLAWTLAKVAAFGVVMFVVGARLFPWVLAWVARRGSRELFTVAILATSVGVAYFAAGLFDVSFALGAFVAGVVVGGSHLDRQIAEETHPLQDAFAVLFFVSVGMLLDPAVLITHPVLVAATLGVILLGKSIGAFALVWVAKYPVRTALVVSASLAQIGEFSFILAAVGVELQLLPALGRDLILAGAILSIALNPLAFKLAIHGADWLSERPRYAQRLQREAAPAVLAWAHHETAPRDHVVVTGHGRVGTRIVDALLEAGVPVVVVERSRPEAEALYLRGVPVVFGDATRPPVLELAGVSQARMLVVALPDPADVRAVVVCSHAACPGLPIVARAHSPADHARIGELGAATVVYAEQEVATAMLRTVLAGPEPAPAGPSEGARG